MQRDLTIRELAELVGKHPETLRKKCRRNKLPGAYRLGGNGPWMISRQAADKLRKVPEDDGAATV